MSFSQYYGYKSHILGCSAATYFLPFFGIWAPIILPLSPEVYACSIFAGVTDGQRALRSYIIVSLIAVMRMIITVIAIIVNIFVMVVTIVVYSYCSY